LSGQADLPGRCCSTPDSQLPTIRQESGISRDRGGLTRRYNGLFEVLLTQWQDVAVPRRLSVVGPVVSRRHVLTAGAALVMLGVTASACGSPPAPPAVDELESQLKMARRDSELAKAAAAAADKPISAALTEVAAERAQHAQALATEIARLAVTSTSTSSQTTSGTPTTSRAAVPPPALSDVINSLHASAASAGQLATSSSGYRAGLLGSIAAACTAAYTVALVSKGSTS
jgi:hypothetical protein